MAASLNEAVLTGTQNLCLPKKIREIMFSSANPTFPYNKWG